MDPSSGYSVSTVRRRKRRKAPSTVRSPRDAVALVRPLVRDADREAFYAIYLDTRNQVLAVELVSLGSLNASIVHPREVYKGAIRLSAASLLVAHNHPSGDPDPSDDDLAITNRLKEAGEVLGIPLLDHVIVGKAGYFSLKEDGRL